MIYLACKNCHWKISSFLIQEIPIKEELTQTDFTLENGNLYIHLSQSKQLTYRTKGDMNYGCCGYNAEGPLNLLCPCCQIPVAREVSDCCSDHYIRVPQETIQTITVPLAWQEKLFYLENSLKLPTQTMNELMTWMRWNPKELKKQIQRLSA